MTPQFLWSAKTIREATGGEVYSDWDASRICIDTRKLHAGDIFVACKGVNVDGHDYVQEAFQKRAAAAIVEHCPVGVDKSKLILVKDAIQSIKDLAKFNQKRSTATIIAVTGSVGKTSTKEALYAAFSSISRAYCSEGNYNNELGLPISIANMPPQTEYAIYELGMSAKGEIAHLSSVLRPDISIITAIAPVHLASFNSVEDIARAKAEIFTGMQKNGTALLNGDSEYYELLHDLAKAHGVSRILSFGLNSKNDNYLIEVLRTNNFNYVKASIMNTEVHYKIAAYGQHQVLNSIIALSVVKHLNLDVAGAALGLEKFTNLKGRGKISQLNVRGKTLLLIDESYNASPTSVRAALRSLNEIEDLAKRRKVAILADMLELGDEEVSIHKSLREDIVASVVDKVITVGGLMHNLFEALPEHLQLAHFKDFNSVIENFDKFIHDMDCVLVKGSFGTKIHKLVQYLEDIS